MVPPSHSLIKTNKTCFGYPPARTVATTEAPMNLSDRGVDHNLTHEGGARRGHGLLRHVAAIHRHEAPTRSAAAEDAAAGDEGLHHQVPRPGSGSTVHGLRLLCDSSTKLCGRKDGASVGLGFRV